MQSGNGSSDLAKCHKQTLEQSPELQTNKKLLFAKGGVAEVGGEEWEKTRHSFKSEILNVPQTTLILILHH